MFDDILKEEKSCGKCGECKHIKAQNKPAIVPNRYCPIIKKYVHMEQFGCMNWSE